MSLCAWVRACGNFGLSPEAPSPARALAAIRPSADSTASARLLDPGAAAAGEEPERREGQRASACLQRSEVRER
eukprot:12549710-Alexandrium_andersonii.AAC.1